ncbi:MAG: 4Fe-4S dicluster domain-containing protein [Flavobacteriaceae bacterium]|nr:4Fe-4S dicluster domain-containing protein [Flavobacteriaceae bacterium]
MAAKKQTSRRTFLNKGLKVGILSTIGLTALAKLFKSDKTEALLDNDTIEVMTAEGDIIQLPATQVEDHISIKHKDYKVREGFLHKKFVMVVDLAKCKNAKKCQASCNKNHYITGDDAWLKIFKMQDSKDTSPYWMPTHCQHCDNPACVTVCPVDATFKRRDGIVLIDNERCIGCRFCMAACPYSARVFNWKEPEQGKIVANLDYSPDYTGAPSVVGTVDKCDFCPHMIDKDKLPHCVTACPNNVFSFGDKYEDTVTNGVETFRLSKLLKERAGYRFMENLGTEPSVYYLPPTNRLEDFEEGLQNYDPFNSVKKDKL